MKSVKILAAMLALSVVGVASVAAPAAPAGSGGVQVICTSSSCTPNQMSPVQGAGSITPAGFAAVYSCQKHGTYSAPTSVNVTYNANNATCGIVTAGGAVTEQGETSPSGKASVAMLVCKANSGVSSVSFTTQSMTCPSSGASATPTSVTNAGTAGTTF